MSSQKFPPDVPNISQDVPKCPQDVIYLVSDDAVIITASATPGQVETPGLKFLWQ